MSRRTAISDAVTATSPVLSDEELMRRVQAGDADAFEALYDRYASRAFGLAIVICNNRQRAEEAVQDAFLSIWRSRARYDPAHSPVRTWLFALIRNRSIDIYRHNRRADSLRASQAHLNRIGMLGSVEDDVVRRDDGDRVRATLHELPAPQREVITLAYFGGLTHTEIAERLDIPLGTVKGRMRLGLEKARAEIVFQDNHNRS